MSYDQVEDNLEELALLADTAGATVVDRIIQDRYHVNPATFIGKGKVNQIIKRVADTEARVVIFDEDLSPVQAKNLEQAINRKIVDRSGLILDIFARRARTREAQIQVELAQLEYFLPRLTRQWTHLSRQEGGIGTRGPGETQLEVDRRAVRKPWDRDPDRADLAREYRSRRPPPRRLGAQHLEPGHCRVPGARELRHVDLRRRMTGMRSGRHGRAWNGARLHQVRSGRIGHHGC